MKINLKNKKYRLKTNLGFVLLFSLLISSILLATGLGISRLMIRQIAFASLSRESQVAFFAADSGLECALHWDNFGKFDLAEELETVPRKIYCNGETIEAGKPSIVKPTNEINCNPNQPPQNNIINGTNKSCFTFKISPPEAQLRDQVCVFVIVDKDPLGDGLGLQTKITANGYNECVLTAPNILQRTLEITLVNPAS
jgi:hypothetical protein